MKKIFVLSLFFTKSLLKQKASLLLVLLSVVSILISLSVSNIDIAKEHKLFEDLLLTSQMFLLHLAALFYSFEFIQKERSHGIFVIPLSTGLKRWKYLLATFTTQVFLLMTLFVSFALLDFLTLFIVEKIPNFMILWQLILYVMSSIILSFMIIMFSQFVSVMNSLIYSVVFLLVGGALDELYYYAHFIVKDKNFENISTVLFYIFPNFSLFDHQGEIVNQAYLDVSTVIIFPSVYFLLLSLLTFSVSLSKFTKRALKFGE